MALVAFAKLLVIQRDQEDEEKYWSDRRAMGVMMEVLVCALREVEVGFGRGNAKGERESLVMAEVRGLIRNAEEGWEMGKRLRE